MRASWEDSRKLCKPKTQMEGLHNCQEGKTSFFLWAPQLKKTKGDLAVTSNKRLNKKNQNDILE